MSNVVKFCKCETVQNAEILRLRELITRLRKLAAASPLSLSGAHVVAVIDGQAK